MNNQRKTNKKLVLLLMFSSFLALSSCSCSGESPTSQPTSDSGVTTFVPTSEPSSEPTSIPTSEDSSSPTSMPTSDATSTPTSEPTSLPTSDEPTSIPTSVPSSIPTSDSTSDVTSEPASSDVSTSTSEPTGESSAIPTSSSIPTSEASTSTSSSEPEPELLFTIRADKISLNSSENSFDITFNNTKYTIHYENFSVDGNVMNLNNGKLYFDDFPGVSNVEIILGDDNPYHFEYGFAPRTVSFTSKTFNISRSYYFNDENPSYFSLVSESNLSIESITIVWSGEAGNNPYKDFPNESVEIEKHQYHEKQYAEFPSFPVTEGLTYNLSDDGTYYVVDNSENKMEIGEDNRIVFPSSYKGLPVKQIGYLGFVERWWIFEIYIPSTITKIENEAFSMCGLTKIYWDAENCEDFPARNGIFQPGDSGNHQNIDIIFGPHVKHIPGHLFLPSMMRPNVLPRVNSIKFTSDCQVESIGEYAFYGLESITRIDLPDSVTTIGDYAFYGLGIEEMYIPHLASIGKSAFRFNEKLKHFYFPQSLTSIGEQAFDSCSALLDVDLEDTQVDDIPFAAFKDCASLTKVKFNNRIRTIDDYAFFNCQIEKLILPTQLQIIGESSFSDNTNLKYLFLNEDLTLVGDSAFAGAVYLEDIVITSNSISDFKLNNKVFLKAGTSSGVLSVYIKDVTKLPDNMFYSSALVDNLPSIQNIYFYSMEFIGIRAFYGQNPANVEYFGFESDLEEVSIGIGNDCLKNMNWREE